MTLSFDQIIKSIEQLPAPEQERIRRWLDLRERQTEDDVAPKHTLTVRQSRSDS